MFWVNVASGLAWAALLAGAAPGVAAFAGGDARLVLLFRGVAGGLVLSSLGIVPQALLVRSMEFRKVALATGLAVVGAVVAGSYGLLHHGILGVAWGYLAFASLNSLAVWLGSGFRPGGRPRVADVVPLLRFGGSAFGATAGERLAQQTERFLIAGFLGAESLGIFALTRSLIRDPLRRFMSVFDEILFPGLAALQGEPERARRYYLTALRYELAIFGPAVVFIAVFADELVRLFYARTGAARRSWRSSWRSTAGGPSPRTRSGRCSSPTGGPTCGCGGSSSRSGSCRSSSWRAGRGGCPATRSPARFSASSAGRSATRWPTA